MSKSMVVFGAGGRAGRAAVAEALRRGHRVTAVVREPSRYTGPDDVRVRLVAGDVTDAAGISVLAAGHDAAIHAAAVYGEGTDPDAFFRDAAEALIKGLRSAGVPRLIAIGLSTLVPGADGVRPVDSADFPAEYRPFSLAHAGGLEVLRAAAAGQPLDWAWIAPAGDFDHDAGRTGRYVMRPCGDPAARISYPDFAIALLDAADSAEAFAGPVAAVAARAAG